MNAKGPVYCSFDAAATAARKLGLDCSHLTNPAIIDPSESLLSAGCVDKANLQEQGLVEFVDGVVEVGFGAGIEDVVLEVHEGSLEGEENGSHYVGCLF